ncbi:MAG: nitrilase-related carbon-nitrogen hydrolase [Muribaculaceae bacterium]|nr:nitrilase-related carbon-nitrogen hydrolase [Muribaculaceae bacterium]
MSRNLNICGIPLNSVWCDKQSNLEALEQNLSTQPSTIDIVVLPEMFSTGFVINDKNQVAELAERNIDDTIYCIKKLSAKYNIAICGSHIARTNTRFYNRAFFIEPSGDEVYYDKHHLFSYGNEQTVYSSGNSLPPIIRFRGWNIMPIICYDLRFPVWCRNVGRKYDLMIVMANWPKVRERAWDQLLIARAIENQCYVCGINRTGTDGNSIVYPDDSSYIIDYKGNIISEKRNEIIFASLDYEKYSKFNEKFTALSDADSFSINL